MKTNLGFERPRLKFRGRVQRFLSRQLRRVFFWMLLALFLFIVLAPFFWMFISSISPQAELAKKPPHWVPESPTLVRYKALFFGVSPGTGAPLPTGRSGFINALSNSFIVSSATTLSCVVAGSAAAYALVRLPIPGKQHFLMGVVVGQMLPAIVIIIPLYIFVQALHLMDTQLGLILVYSGFILAIVMWIMHSYFQTIPLELEEAAMIDGTSRIGALLRVILPLSGPGLVAVSAFAFLSSWSEFFIALIFTGSRAKVMTVVITEFGTQTGIDYGLAMTGGVIGSIPPLILVFLLQRYIVEGLTAGALKG